MNLDAINPEIAKLILVLVAANIAQLGTIITGIVTFVVDFKVMKKDVARLETQVEQLENDLNSAFSKIRELEAADTA